MHLVFVSMLCCCQNWQEETKSEGVTFPSLPDCPRCSTPTYEDELAQFGMCAQCKVCRVVFWLVVTLFVVLFEALLSHRSLHTHSAVHTSIQFLESYPLCNSTQHIERRSM